MSADDIFRSLRYTFLTIYEVAHTDSSIVRLIETGMHRTLLKDFGIHLEKQHRITRIGLFERNYESIEWPKNTLWLSVVAGGSGHPCLLEYTDPKQRDKAFDAASSYSERDISNAEFRLFFHRPEKFMKSIHTLPYDKIDRLHINNIEFEIFRPLGLMLYIDCASQSINGDDIHTQVVNTIDHIQRFESWANGMIKYVRETHEHEVLAIELKLAYATDAIFHSFISAIASQLNRPAKIRIASIYWTLTI